ncbi:MAG: hypothetical protein ACI8R8_002149, partial [Paraglaciecola sp.]
MTSCHAIDGLISSPYLVRVKSGRLLADTWSQKMGYFILRPKYGNGKKKKLTIYVF